MCLKGKVVRQIEIKSGGDLFHELFKHKPHHVANMSPKVKGCDLHEGGWGTVGSIISWTYSDDGKEKAGKEIVEAIDDEKKLVTFKLIEGDLLQLYKAFVITVQVDTKGNNNLVTWTSEYEKLNEGVEDPNTFMDYLVEVTKDIETHHLK